MGAFATTKIRSRACSRAWVAASGLQRRATLAPREEMLAGLVLLRPLSQPLHLRPRAWPPLACDDGWNFVEAKRGLPEVPPILAAAAAP